MPTELDTSKQRIATTQQHTEQPSQQAMLHPEAQQTLFSGGITLATIAGVVLLIREVRLLVEACK